MKTQEASKDLVSSLLWRLFFSGVGEAGNYRDQVSSSLLHEQRGQSNFGFSTAGYAGQTNTKCRGWRLQALGSLEQHWRQPQTLGPGEDYQIHIHAG